MQNLLQKSLKRKKKNKCKFKDRVRPFKINKTFNFQNNDVYGPLRRKNYMGIYAKIGNHAQARKNLRSA